MTTLLLCPWIGAVAFAQRPRIQRGARPPATTNPPRSKTDWGGQLVPGKPDLVCSIVVVDVRSGPAERSVTADGGTLLFDGGEPSVWARITMENAGSGSAGRSSTWVGVKREGRMIQSMAYPSFPVPAGGEPYLGPIVHEIDLTPGTHVYKVLARVDQEDGLEETNESNNACARRFTAEARP